jgi:hypothetical protein
MLEGTKQLNQFPATLSVSGADLIYSASTITGIEQRTTVSQLQTYMLSGIAQSNLTNVTPLGSDTIPIGRSGLFQATVTALANFALQEIGEGSLATATALTGAEFIPISQNSQLVQTTAANIAALALSALAPVRQSIPVLTAGQSVYVSQGYSPGLLNVFVAGFRLNPSQYVALDGIHITISDTMVLGIIVPGMTVDVDAVVSLAVAGAATPASVQALDPANQPAIGSFIGSEIISTRQGAGLFQSTLTKIAQWIIQTYQGFTQTASGAIARTVTGKLLDFAATPQDFGIAGSGDDTPLFQAAANRGGRIRVPAGTYVISSVNLTTSVTFECDPGVTFQRKAGTDIASGSYWTTGTACFEIATAGLTVRFEGGFTYNGNNTNQVTVEPTGFFLKTTIPATVTGSPTVVYLDQPVFTNGTSGYLCLRGDSVARRYETKVYLEKPIFYETVYGKGQNDPSTPTTLGYAPGYVFAYDYVSLCTYDFAAYWRTALTTGKYAANAIFGSFVGTDYTQAGRPSILMFGKTLLNGVGRSTVYYDGSSMNNNGTGAIDGYGYIDSIFIEHLDAVNTQFTAVRAKSALNTFTILKARLNGCWRGLQVDATQFGSSQAIVSISNVWATSCSAPVIECTGTSLGSLTRSVTLDNILVDGTVTNPEAVSYAASVYVAYVNELVTNRVEVQATAPTSRAMYLLGVNYSTHTAINLAQSNAEGCYIDGGVAHEFIGGAIGTTTLSGITVYDNPVKFTARDLYIANAGSYGIYANTTTTRVTIDTCDVGAVGGTAAFYLAGGDVTVNNCSAAASIPTPLIVAAGTNKRETNNSWNARISYGTAAPVAGTWAVGDLVYNKAPGPGTPQGWVCTAAGSPGTWVTFGLIYAASGAATLSAPLSITDSSSADFPLLTISGTNDTNGATIQLVGNGATTPIKTIKVVNGSFRIVNSAGNANLMTLDDSGNMAATGGLSIAPITTTSAPAAGGGGALPATPTGYMTITVGGTARQVPYY